MGDTTDKLVTLSNKVSKQPNPRDYDMLLSTGEQVSVAVLSMILNNINVDDSSNSNIISIMNNLLVQMVVIKKWGIITLEIYI